MMRAIHNRLFLLGNFDLENKEWSGVMGDVILEKFPFSLAPWLTNEERVRVLDLEGKLGY